MAGSQDERPPRAAAPANATQSPYDYAEMKARQRTLNSGMSTPLPGDESVPTDVVPPDTTGATAAGVDSTSLNTPAVAESTVTPEPKTPVNPNFDEKRAKRAVVLNALRNSSQGMGAFATHVRRAYNVSKNFKATPEEILRAGFSLSRQNIPDMTPEEYVKAIHSVYGEQVDKSLLTQAHEDYPGHTDEPSLIDKMYLQKIAKEEAGPLSWADKAQIIARRYPELHKSDMEPEKALRTIYDAQKKQRKDVGSFDDWMHTQMAPTLAERGYAFGGGLLSALKEQGMSVARLAHEAGTPGQLTSDIALATQAGDSKAGEEAKARLTESGMGAVNVGALAAGPAARAGLGALESAAGVAKTAPLLAGAAEGATVGGLQGAGTAAVEGKPLSEVLQSGATGAGIGAGIGGVLEHAGAASVAKKAALAKAEADAAAVATAKAEAAAEAARLAEINKGSSLAPSKYEDRLVKFAREHDVTVEEARRAIEAPESSAWAPPTATVQEMKQMRELAADAADARKAELPSVGSAETPPTESPTAAAAPEAAADRGLAQNPVSEKMTEALNRAQAQLPERARLRRQALSERLGAARAAGGVSGGLDAFRTKLAMMAGEMKKPEWNGVKDLFSDVDVDELHNAILRSNLLEGDKLTAGHGLNRLLGIGGTRMGAPTRSQIEALRLAFGTKFVEAVEKNPTLARKALDVLNKSLNTPRTAMTTLDVSMGGRQGYLMASQPEYRRGFKDMLRAFGDKKVEESVAQAIKDEPLYDVMRASGLHLQGDPFKTKSEAFAGSWISNWTGVRNSEAAANTFLNSVRANMFKRVYEDYARAGVDVSDPHFRQSLAKWLNTGTGRGDFSWFGRDANIFNAVMFSPRLFWSRVETFNPGYYASLHPAVRAAALKANANVVGGTMALLAGLGMSGAAQVGLDPRNSDFAKAKVGNTRIDLFAGHQQIARVMAQLLTGKVISSTTGREIDLNGSDDKNGFRRAGMTRADVIARFMEAKAAPLVSLALALARGQDFTGAPISVPDQVIQRFTPMVIQDAADAFQDAGLQRAALVAPLALSGVGTQTYSANLPGERQSNTGVVVNAGHWLANKLNGNATDNDLPRLHAQLAEQWVKDAAMAQVMGHQEATKVKGFFDKGFDQKSEIRKATARRMRGVNKLYKDLSGANGEQARMAAEKDQLQRRAQATGMDPEALSNPNVYSEVTK